MEKKSVSMTVRLEEALAEKILRLAQSDERSTSYVIRKLLIQALENSERGTSNVERSRDGRNR